VCALDKEFTGVERLRAVKEAGPERKLVAFVADASGVPRAGMEIEPAGVVTSGTHSPSLGRGIGMGYVPAAAASVDTPIEISVRGRPLPAHLVAKPIYKKEH
jgi:aminomethyltransferase